MLAVWRVSPPPAPDFKASVWRRIAAEEERMAAGFFARLREWLCVQLPRPAYATVLLAATVALGATVANLHATRMREHSRLESAHRYLTSIDPISMAASSPRPAR